MNHLAVGCVVAVLAGTAGAAGVRAQSTGSAQDVPAQANIFGAGRRVAPAPGGGGGGVLPTMWRLAAGSNRVVTFSNVTGRVNPIESYDAWNGAGGDMAGPTNVRSYRGISGIIHRKNGMFLVGVFLTDGRPPKVAPRRLDFTGRERFEELAPKIGQTFFIGDGVGRRYIVPARATRVFLGFADAYLYVGAPGWYGNNVGKLTATVEVTTT